MWDFSNIHSDSCLANGGRKALTQGAIGSLVVWSREDHGKAKYVSSAVEEKSKGLIHILETGLKIFATNVG